MSFLAALRFLTIIPIPGRRGGSPEELGRSTSYFPVIGAMVGLSLAGLSWLFGLILPSAIVNMLLIVYLVVISGALHLDGLVDTCDGIVGKKTVEERWQVMDDSHAGSFGAIGVFCLLLAKYVSLSSVPEYWLLMTLVLMPVVSRWAMVYAIFAYPYARPSGLGKVFKQGASWRSFTVATVITLAVIIGLTWWANIAYFYLVSIVLMCSIWAIVALMAIYLKHKFTGLTGDTYGAINEVVEVSVLMLVSMLTYNQWLWLAWLGGILV